MGKKPRRFRIIAEIDTLGDREIPPPHEWTGEWLEDAIDEWRFEHLELVSVVEITDGEIGG